MRVGTTCSTVLVSKTVGKIPLFAYLWIHSVLFQLLPYEIMINGTVSKKRKIDQSIFKGLDT